MIRARCEEGTCLDMHKARQHQAPLANGTEWLESGHRTRQTTNTCLTLEARAYAGKLVAAQQASAGNR